MHASAQKNSIQVLEALKKSVEVSRLAPGFFIQFGIAFVLLGILLGWLQVWIVMQVSAWKIAILLSVALFRLLVDAIFCVGVFQLFTRGSMDLGDVFSTGLKRFLPFFGVSLLYDLWTILGTLLLIVPGVYVGMVYFFAPYIALFKDKVEENPLGTSKEQMKGHFLSLAKFVVPMAFLRVGIELLGSGGVPGELGLPMLSQILVSLMVMGLSVVYVRFYLDIFESN